jgi:hypothetical protein
MADDPKEEPSPEPEEKKTSLADEIKTAVREVLGSLLDSGEVTVEDKADKKPEKDEKPPGPREEEKTMEELVRAEVEKLKQQTPSEPTKEPSPPETPPNTTGRKIQRWMWGDIK